VRVLLDTTYGRRAPYSGTAIYLDRVARALGAIGGVEIVEAANADRRPPSGGGAGRARNAIADWRWIQSELPRRARAAGADVIHHPLPARAYAREVPQVVTVHDLAFELVPDRFDPGYRRYARLAHRAAARGAGAVICVSEATAADVRDHWGISPARIVIARHGPGQDLGIVARMPAAHFLYVGDDEPRKDVAGLLEAYRCYADVASSPLALVLAGSAHAAPAGVRVELRPTPARLAELHAAAAALVHPAVHEGFGLTPLEAMRLGTPVIAAATPAVAEICGDAARYVSPGDTRALAGAMAAVGASEALQRELGDRGRRRAAQFSWDLSARAHLEAYALARAGGRSPRRPAFSRAMR
jgi:glycosyltransferase involved in cell wall biosynthesis